VEGPNSPACNLAGEVVRNFGGLQLRVTGASMVPTIRPGDLVTVEKAAVTEISQGDVVVFARDGRLVAHRVVAHAGDLRDPLLITRGDRMTRDDSPVSAAELVGRVARIERRGRRVQIRARLSATQQALARLFRISDRATGLYLRLSA